jgi:hypothetical protein
MLAFPPGQRYPAWHFRQGPASFEAKPALHVHWSWPDESAGDSVLFGHAVLTFPEHQLLLGHALQEPWLWKYFSLHVHEQFLDATAVAWGGRLPHAEQTRFDELVHAVDSFIPRPHSCLHGVALPPMQYEFAGHGEHSVSVALVHSAVWYLPATHVAEHGVCFP